MGSQAVKLSGGCQCGAIRYKASGIGTASICHCRMCQKAAGNYFMPLLEVESFELTRGELSRFASSNLSNRGFCSSCGTPLALETSGKFEVMIGSLDDPAAVRIECHVNVKDRVAVTQRLTEVPEASADRKSENDAWNAKIKSFQHPDRDTEEWPPEFWFSADHF